jgi:hypothetical protein
MSDESRVRNRISPIQRNIGSAVRVQDEEAPQMVTAMASPAARGVNNSMPIQPTPSRARPIQMPLPSRANRARIRAKVIAISMAYSLLDRFAAGVAMVLLLAANDGDQFLGQGDGEDAAADGHAQLRNPQRRGIRALRDVVELEGLPHQACREPGQQHREQQAGGVAPEFQGLPRARPGVVEDQGDADVFAALEGMRHGEEGGRRHAVAGVGVGAANMEIEQAPADRKQDHGQGADHEQRRRPGGGAVQTGRARAAATSALTSGRRRGWPDLRRRRSSAIRRSWCRRPSSCRP